MCAALSSTVQSIHTSFHLLTHSLTHSLSLTHSHSLSLTHSITYSLTHSRSLTHLLTHSHSLTHSLAHSHSFTHSPSLFGESIPLRNMQSTNTHVYYLSKNKRNVYEPALKRSHARTCTPTLTFTLTLAHVRCHQCAWAVLTRRIVRKGMISFCAMDVTPKHTYDVST